MLCELMLLLWYFLTSMSVFCAWVITLCVYLSMIVNDALLISQIDNFELYDRYFHMRWGWNYYGKRIRRYGMKYELNPLKNLKSMLGESKNWV